MVVSFANEISTLPFAATILPPLSSDHLPCGEEVAGHLDRLFNRFGSPLFCKRDNGGIEHIQGEFKDYLRHWQCKAESPGHCAILAETAAHDINHRPRRCLEGKTACRTFFDGDRLKYPKRRRQQVYRWIQNLAERISIGLGKAVVTTTAWRVAAKQWLLENGLIRIVKAGEVLPNFSPIWSHN